MKTMLKTHNAENRTYRIIFERCWFENSIKLLGSEYSHIVLGESRKPIYECQKTNNAIK